MADETTGSGSGTDDEFDRQLRALTEGLTGQARFKELSADQRAKAAARQSRQARKEAARQAKEAKRAARRQRTAGGIGSGGSGIGSGGRGGGRGGRRGLRAGWLVLVLILAVSGGVAWLRIGHPLSGGPDDTQVVKNGALPSGASPSASARPDAPASPAAVLSGPPADPFATVPADHWADGAAGIVAPAAHPAGSFSAAQVADAYATTRKLLIAAGLDRQTLLGGAPTAFADLLTNQQRAHFIARLDKIGHAKDGTVLSTRYWVVAFAPGTTQLIGSVIKVHGVMSASAATDQGHTVLDVEVNYRFVYPVEPPRVPADWIRIVGQVSGIVEFGDWAQAKTTFEPWVEYSIATAGARCGVASDGFVHPLFPNGPADTVQPSGAAQDPYSMTERPVRGCAAVTRT